MDLKENNALIHKQLKGTYCKYVLLLLLCTLITSLLNIAVPMTYIIEHPIWYPLYVLVMLALVVIQNTVYFVFIKRVRSEHFHKADIRYSFQKSGLHILSALLFEILQLGILLLVQYAALALPMLASCLSLMVQVIMSSIALFIAFAIYDGVKGAMNIVNNSFRLMLANIKDIFWLSLPFLIWMLIYQLINGYLIAHFSVKEVDSLLQVLMQALQREALIPYVYGYLALEIVHLVISCIILVPLYMGFANLYEQNYIHFYPFSTLIHTNVIDLDYDDTTVNSDIDK